MNLYYADLLIFQDTQSNVVLQLPKLVVKASGAGFVVHVPIEWTEFLEQRVSGPGFLPVATTLGPIVHDV
jgi:hypothetical protein